MRLLLATLTLLLPVLLTAAAPKDWTAVATKTPAGFYRIGNPAARVKLVEYASYTCPHCAHFSNESGPVLKDRLIRSGQVSLEFRHFLFNGLDVGVALLARCTAPSRFADTTAFIYRTQDEWIARAQRFQAANRNRLALYPPAGQMRALVDGSGLTAAIVARGLAPAAVDACFADAAEVDQLSAMAGAPGVTSTPTFFLNGRRLAGNTWAQVASDLRAAGVR